ncbi:hypothetical protein B0H13DRAFT_2321046 [Mycena leptocephala]|nr:hypothetical protein B0H13DRAFT_2321046 [Mycena leptocephala]
MVAHAFKKVVKCTSTHIPALLLYSQQLQSKYDPRRSRGQFAAGIFDDVLNVTLRPRGTPAPRPSRARFQWPAGTTQEDCLLVAFRCMQHAGFETIGGYFKAVLDHGHPKVYNSVSAFLQCRATDPNTHPISIFQRIFKDPRSKKRAGADDELHLGPPRYALPLSQRSYTQ